MSRLSYDPTHCTLCPRRCGGDRTRAKGYCRMPARPVVARAALHFWEEPPLSGTRGAGTVFFSGCSLGCVFCQNEAISQRDFGKEISVERLREIFWALIDAGAHNIDLVNPTHYAHVVAEALSQPLPVPVVWNSGGYDRVETLRALEGAVDIYLPELLDWVRATFLPHSVLFSLMSQYIPWGRAAEFPPLDRRLRKREARAAMAYLENLSLDGFFQGEEAARAEYIPAFDLTGV